MNRGRVHITGASGSGTTTLGRALAQAWSVPHADTDDYFWMPTTPPYTTKRPEADRVRLMRELFLDRDAWVLSGTLVGWGDEVAPHFDLVVFLSLGNDARLGRLTARERVRYGARIDPGGDLAGAHEEFLGWAAGYEDPTFDGRSRAMHERWLAGLDCPVLRLDSGQPVNELVEAVLTSEPSPGQPSTSR
ncbi:adenylate kinase family enzyme [Knoellia remsis]|uniref:Adenylate kinase family enzyme n=1 Tax=Knoellia remsis TaxID=407159 RepID=A0A2T0TTD3_9MICO|nr:hypothetical protein [Knoellia remsis]PRY48911.1 adenylate kinase family enzyme [Knoellia remsis]